MGNSKDQNHKMLFLEHGGSTVICLRAVKSFSVGISCVLLPFWKHLVRTGSLKFVLLSLVVDRTVCDVCCSVCHEVIRTVWCHVLGSWMCGWYRYGTCQVSTCCNASVTVHCQWSHSIKILLPANLMQTGSVQLYLWSAHHQICHTQYMHLTHADHLLCQQLHTVGS